EGSSCKAAPEGRTRGVLSVRSTRRGASPPFRTLPPGFVAPAKPALESGTLPRPGVANGSEIAQHCVECSTSSAGFARATDSWGRLRRGPSRPPPIKRRRWALIIALGPLLPDELDLAVLAQVDPRHGLAPADRRGRSRPSARCRAACSRT